MIEFHSLEEILDFAILQEKAAQAFYRKLAAEVTDPDVRIFYHSMIEEEEDHEQKLRRLKHRPYTLTEPDLAALHESGYLQAMPVKPDITFLEAVKYALDKERSARLLYNLLADTIRQEDFSRLFRDLADQEAQHAEFFKKEYLALCAARNPSIPNP